MKPITTIGIDLAKNSFTVYGVNAQGKPVLQRTLTRAGVIRFFANLPECLVGMEACASSEYWARTIESMGHTVRRIHPRYVKAYSIASNMHIVRWATETAAVAGSLMVIVPILTSLLIKWAFPKVGQAISGMLMAARGVGGKISSELAPFRRRELQPPNRAMCA